MLPASASVQRQASVDVSVSSLTSSKVGYSVLSWTIKLQPISLLVFILHLYQERISEELTSPITIKIGYIKDKVLGGDLVLPG